MSWPLPRRLLALCGLGLLLAAAPFAAARATPTLSLQLSASGFSPQTYSVAAGNVVSGPSSYAGFTFATITGYGQVIDPMYISLTIQVTGVTNVIPLTISLTETDFPGGFGAQASFSTDNTANFSSGSTAAVSTYWDSTDAAFGTENQLFSSTLTKTTGETSAQAIAYVLGSFSVTKIIVWTPGSTGSHPLITSEVDVSIPEPLSLSLIGSGLLGLGAIRRFRQGRRSAQKPG